MSATSVVVRAGDVVRVRLPWSEVCLHMRVADRVMNVEVREHGAQLMSDNGRPFSSPITHGEAGLYPLGDGKFRAYPEEA